ncbi:MAG: cytochrome c peroxidase [Methyloprofundus sp.]|nr:MAG: cytochrome c peroxidase [Methyloprofundus sp.]
MKLKQIKFFSIVGLIGFSQNIVAETTLPSLVVAKQLTLEQQLGKQIFFDKNLSFPAGQSCASCHDSKVSFTDAIQNLPVSLGAVEGRTGSRNTPSAGYAAFAPQFHFDTEEELYIGGQFLDGRAVNLKEQAKAPFLNPDEMNNTDENSVIEKIKTANYADLFKQVFGVHIFNDTTDAYDKMAQAIVAYENTPSFNQFTSKYDYFLAGRVSLTELEQKGLELFEDETKGNCAACHISSTGDGSQPLFTDFTYDNLGTPANLEILALKGVDFVDLGLGETVGSEENGKFKVPSLRNVAKTAPYMHNGVFADLKEVVDFYNTRDVDAKWAAPEVAANVNADELGDLGLTDAEVEAIVAFMRTLTDGYQLQEQSAFSAELGVIELPYLRTEGANQPSKFYSVQLQQVEQGLYVVSKFDEIVITNLSTLESMPYYSFDTGLLELTQISNFNGAKQAVSYVAQLQYLPTADGVLSFKLVYAKKLQ